jgi:hypothetical protein
MGWIESQITRAEERIEYLFRQVGELRDQLRGVQQGVQGAYQQGGGESAPGNDADVFFANAATGVWPSITPTSTTADVYKVAAGALVLVTAGATVYNFMPDATDATKRQILGSNGDGSYSALTQSCSAG